MAEFSSLESKIVSDNIGPLDQHLGIEKYGVAWHGKTKLCKEITAQSVVENKAAPRIITVENPPFLIEGEQVTFDGCKVLVADLRDRLNEDVVIEETKGRGLHPISLHGDGYEVCDFSRFLEVVEASLKDIKGAEITSYLTMGNLAVVAASIDLPTLAGFKIGEALGWKDTWTNRLMFLSSHDGSRIFTAKFCTERSVCENTVNIALSQAGMRKGVKHTRSMSAQLDNLAEVIKEALKEREQMIQSLEHWTQEGCTMGQAMALYLCFFGGSKVEKGIYTPSKEGVVSTRNMNRASSAAILHTRGTGTGHGTVYDAFNGFTELFTKGIGTGKASEAAEKKWSKSEFGRASNHKLDFYRFLSDVTESGNLATAYAEGAEIERRMLLKSGSVVN